MQRNDIPMDVGEGMPYDMISLESLGSFMLFGDIDGSTAFQACNFIIKANMLQQNSTPLTFILNTGGLLSVGHEKVLLLQNTLNLETSETISTYVYRLSFQSSIPDYSYSTAIGLFNSVVNFIVILSVNALSKRVTETSLW